jgi:mRNA-degrading endonuclease RelE of RelBE toxin-antitoxin system
MNLTFVEAEWFTKRLKARLHDNEYMQLQQALLRNPASGDAMPGCGGLRKLRWGDARKGRGKSGAFRVIYLWIPQAFRIDLLDIYGKNEKQDLSA